MIKAIKNRYYIFRDINRKDENGKTQLHKAAERGDVKNIKDLLDKGANPNVKDRRGNTPLHYAALNERAEAFETLIGKDYVDLTIQNDDGEIALHYVAGRGHTELLKTFINKMDKRPDLLNLKNRNGDTPLHYTALCNRAEALETLIGSDYVDLNIQNNNGRTPLHLAAENEHTEAAKLLINYTLSKDPQTQKPAFLEEPRHDELSRHFDACSAEIEQMKTCNDLSKLETDDHISLHKLFCAADTKKLFYLGERLDIEKCIEKIEEHRDKFPIYYDFLKEQVIKARNTELMKNKFLETLQSQNLKFNEDVVGKIFSHLDRNDIASRLARAYIPKQTSPCEVSEAKTLAKTRSGNKKSSGGLK